MIAVYQTVNGCAPAMHWWLASNKKFGPQLYNFTYDTDASNPNCKDANHVGPIVLEVREDSNILDPAIYELHQESLRQMENFNPNDYVVDCTSDYFSKLTEYQMPVWSNYFGNCQNGKIPLADKLLYCNHTPHDSCFFYVTQYAFVELDVEKIEDDTKNWWEDHKLVNNKVVDNWKDVWYNAYHKQVLKDFEAGKLKYMWQLNFAHWDLEHALLEGKTYFNLDYSFERLFENRLSDVDDNDSIVWQANKHKYDHMDVTVNWFDNTQAICDYLNVEQTDDMKSSAGKYRESYLNAMDRYHNLFGKYLIN